MSKLYYRHDIAEVRTEIIDRIDIDGTIYYRFADELFYPGGGGAPRDRGFANGRELCDCVTVMEQNYYAFDGDIGEHTADCTLDLPYRIDCSTQHTAQHLLSAIFDTRFGAKTDSFHLGESYCSIELSRIDLTYDMLCAAEDEANDCIRRCLGIETEILPRAQAERLVLRKAVSVDTDSVRIVRIGDIDASACAGTHMQNTGELNLVKIIKSEHKRGATRIFFLAGERAIKDYRNKSDILSHSCALLSCQTDELCSRIERELNLSASLKKECAKLKQELAEHIVRELLATDSDVLVYESEPETLGNIAAIMRNQRGRAFIGIAKESRRLILVQNELRPLPEIVSRLSAAYNISGGGGEQRAQLAYTEDTPLNEVLDELEKYFHEI